tara:strand:- start:246 stop:374 length:129 start_codon:yes stop_codon:yes gene_type:complete
MQKSRKKVVIDTQNLPFHSTQRGPSAPILMGGNYHFTTDYLL